MKNRLRLRARAGEGARGPSKKLLGLLDDYRMFDKLADSSDDVRSRIVLPQPGEQFVRTRSRNRNQHAAGCLGIEKQLY